MEGGYDHNQVQHHWDRMYPPHHQQQQNISPYPSTSHSAYPQNHAASMPSTTYGAPSGYPALAQPSSLQAPSSYVPGPPVSSGPQYPMSTSTMASSYIAPAPSRNPSDLPQGHYGGLPMPSQYGQVPHFQQRLPTTEQEPVHVVGQQGRRGVLPSAPGRPPASAGKSVGALNKDEDGKYPCQHCAKTYQHAKHLKRHMLRHTGDRPYQCILCNDTFSRSDILKRHFQKCSQRRGNPTGATHLSGSQAHLRKTAQNKANEQEGFLSASSTPQLSSDSTFSGGNWPSMSNISSEQSYAQSLPAMSLRPSRSNSGIFSPSEMHGDSRRGLSGMEHINSPKYEFNGGRDFGIQSSAAGDMNGLPGYSMPQGQSSFYEQR